MAEFQIAVFKFQTELHAIDCGPTIDRFLDSARNDNMHHLIQVWFDWVLIGGYFGIIVLMAMGSTPLPVPAEVVVPPAAFLAAQGRLSFVGVIVASTVGSYLGAALMYWLSLWLGRPLVLRFGRFFLFPPKKLEEAEHWLTRYEAGGVFFARLLPGVRHLVSIPAGIVRMKFWTFSYVTVAGSAISCAILAFVGERAYRAEPDLLSDPEGLIRFVRGQSRWILLGVLIFAGLYILALRLTKPQRGASR
jgi:membrane protein DedA with SNARE-associated domain